MLTLYHSPIYNTYSYDIYRLPEDRPPPQCQAGRGTAGSGSGCSSSTRSTQTCKSTPKTTTKNIK